MPYINPSTVLSPKNVVAEVEVIHDTKVGGWSVAKLLWKNKPALGIRWNGDDSQSIGNPQSRGNPTWFVVPEELAEVILSKAEELARSKQTHLEQGYRAMALDSQREADASEWIEGLGGETLG